jgi:hypothetical protein
MSIKDAMAEGVESFLKDEASAERDIPYLYEQEAKKERPSVNLHRHRWVNDEIHLSDARWAMFFLVCIGVGVLIGAILLKLIP